MTTYPMRCRVRAQDGGSTSIEVYDDIGAGGWFSEGLTAKAFTALLADVKGPLDVHINSGGGDVADGIAIGSAIRNYKGPKRTVVDGMAASIASVIMQAGDERVIEPGAMVMIHDPLTMTSGNAADMRKVADTLDKHGDNLASIYAGRAGGTPEQWRDVMKTEAWYTADEAVAAGLADKVGQGAAVLPDGLDLAAFTALPGRIAAALQTMPKPPVVAGPPGTETPVCQTCTGRGTVPHPGTGQNTLQCPGCKGTGLYSPPPDEPDNEPGAQDHAQGPDRPVAELTFGELVSALRDGLKADYAAARADEPAGDPAPPEDGTGKNISAAHALEQYRAALKGASA